MQIGTLVHLAHTSSIIGVVIGEWTHGGNGEEHWLVQWLTGKYTGDIDALIESDLERLCT